jgi:hypothetical protein
VFAQTKFPRPAPRQRTAARLWCSSRVSQTVVLVRLTWSESSTYMP